MVDRFDGREANMLQNHYREPITAAMYCPDQQPATTAVMPQTSQSTRSLVVDESVALASVAGVAGFLLGILATLLWRMINEWRITRFVPLTPPPRQPVPAFLPRRVATADLLEDDDARDDAFWPLGEDEEAPKQRSPPCWFCGLPRDIGNHDH